MMTPTNTDTPDNRNWFADRLRRRIDRLWLGGVVVVNILAWVFLGAEHITTFLIGYFFIFTLCFREQIKASFPPTKNVLYADSSNIINPHVPLHENIRHQRMIAVAIIFMMFSVVLIVYFAVEMIPFTASEIGVSIINCGINYFFLIHHKAFFSGFTGDCLIFFRTGNDNNYSTDAGNISRQDNLCNSCVLFFQILRPTGTLILMALLWLGLSWAYMKGIVNDVFFQPNTVRDAIFEPFFLNGLLFLITEFSLISLEEKP